MEIRQDRDTTWMRLSAGLAPVALIIAIVENTGKGPEGLVLPLLVLPAATLMAHGLVFRLPWVVLIIGTVVGPTVLFFLDYAEGGLFFLCLMALIAIYSMRVRGLAVGLTCVLAAVPIVAGLTTTPDSGWAFWCFGILLAALFGDLGRRNTELIAQLEAQRAHISDQATVAERQRIARDIHDLVGHSLTVVMLHITGARRSVRRDLEAAEQALAAAEEVGRDSLAEIRHSVSLLRDDGSGDIRPSPTAGDIATLVEHGRAAGQAIDFRVDGELATVGAAIGLTGYRIVQEALANAARHAPTSPVDVELTVDEQRWSIRIGNAIVERQTTVSDGGGFGLISMRERVRAFGGSLVVGPTGRRWVVDVELPLARSASWSATEASQPSGPQGDDRTGIPT